MGCIPPLSPPYKLPGASPGLQERQDALRRHGTDITAPVLNGCWPEAWKGAWGSPLVRALVPLPAHSATADTCSSIGSRSSSPPPRMPTVRYVRQAASQRPAPVWEARSFARPAPEHPRASGECSRQICTTLTAIELLPRRRRAAIQIDAKTKAVLSPHAGRSTELVAAVLVEEGSVQIAVGYAPAR